MVGDEFSESAKAVQEVAKTTKAGIEATEKLGGFVSRIIGEPTDTVIGILTDKLKFMRWERQIRLTERAKEIINQKNIEGELKIVPPKIALPIIENASLEENDELQDLWACLIASSVDPNHDGTLRAAFIDIIKQLEVNDVHILNLIYSHYLDYEMRGGYVIRRVGARGAINNTIGNRFPVSMRFIIEKLGISAEIYKESIDNLIRVRCIASFISNEQVKVLSKKSPFSPGYDNVKTDRVNFNVTHIYDKVCITPLDMSFAKACMLPKSEESKEV
jgi:hypothetical protein